MADGSNLSADDISAGLGAADPSANSPSEFDPAKLAKLASAPSAKNPVEETEAAVGAVSKNVKDHDETILDLLEKMPKSIDQSKLPKVDTPVDTPAPTPPKPRELLQNFGSAASVLGILGGALLKAPVSASLDASAAAMKAANAGDWKQYQEKYKQWKDQTELAWRRADFQSQAFNRALDISKTDMAQYQSHVQMLAKQFGYDDTQALKFAMFPSQMAELQTKLDLSGQRYKALAEKNQVQGDFLAASHNLAMAKQSGDPEAITKAQEAYNSSLDDYRALFAPTSLTKILSPSQMQSQAAQLRIEAQGYPVGSAERVQLEGQAKSIEDSLSASKAGSTAVPRGLLTPEAIQLDAETYLSTGTMPALGLGNQGDRAAIQNKAAELAASQGSTAADILAGRAQYKADGSSLTNIQKMADSAEAYEATMVDNIKVLRGLMNKGAGTSAGPVVNRWIQAGRKATGDPDVAAFDAAVNTVANEYARVMSGTTGSQARLSDSARDEASKLINKFGSPDQINETIDRTILPDTRNRITENNVKLGDIRKRIGKTDSSSAVPEQVAAPPKSSDGKIDAGNLVDGQSYQLPQGVGVWNTKTKHFDLKAQ